MLLSLKVRPSARRSGWRGTHAGSLRLDLAATPESGRANAALLAFIAASFGVSVSDVELRSGPRSRHKRIRIAGQWHLPPELAEHLPATESAARRN